MTDLLEVAAAELRSSLGSEGPSVSELRARGQRRRRRQLTGGLVVVGLAMAVVVVAVRPSDDVVVNVSVAQPDASPAPEAPVTSVLYSGTVVAQADCVPMPDVVGLEEIPAMVALSTVGASWRQAERQTLDTPVGVVLDQSPAAGSSVCADAEVSITLSIAPYVVQVGDYYVSIANAAGVDVDALLAINDRTPETPLFPGDQLIIPGRDTSDDASTGSTAFATIPTTTGVAAGVGDCAVYEVQPGDSLSLIAIKFALTVDELVRVNPGLDVIRPGDMVNIPVAGVGPDGSRMVCDLNGNPVG